MAAVGNVLVIGGEGVGKSTLISTVLGSGTQKTMEGGPFGLPLFESPTAPFRIIDAGDMGGSFFARRRAIGVVRRWSKQNALDEADDNNIHLIWFCVEGKSRKLIRQQIRSLSRATDVWRSVPIIVVITKSYAEAERDGNVELVRQACARRKRLVRSIRAIIPVVASTYSLSDTAIVAPAGIPELIDATVEALPEGLQASDKDIADFALRRKRSVARGIVAASAAAGAAVGAVPIPISDALILTPIETSMVGALSKLYGIGDDSSSKMLFATILEAGTVSTAAKGAISALKAVPGINLAASVLNAAIAGSIVAAIGEGSTRIFERISCGEKTIDDVEWVRKFLESRLSKEMVAKGTKLLGQVPSGESANKQRTDLIKLLGSAIKESS